MAKLQKSTTEKERIDSWKEIAAFFERDERTVKRWEKERALPIHRIPGERGGVFAYAAELTGWLNSNRAAKRVLEFGEGTGIPPVEPPQPVVPDMRTEAAAEEPAHEAAVEAAPEIVPRSGFLVNRTAGRMPGVLIGLAVLVVIAGGAGFAIYSRVHAGRRAAQTAVALRAGQHIPTTEAQELYLKGRYYWNHRTEGSLKQAVDAFTQAVVHDSDYAPAYAGLADSYNLMPEYSPMRDSEAFPRAIAAARKAIALDESLSEGHRALAFGLFYWEWDTKGALREYRRAIELNPRDVEANHWYATTLLTLGRLDEASVQIERARELDPTSRAILVNQVFIKFWAGERKESLKRMLELERAEPDFLKPPRYLARMMFTLKDYPGFIEQTKRAAALSGDPLEVPLAEAAERGWNKGGERGLLEQMRVVQQKAFDDGQASGFDLARTCAMLGRTQEANRYYKAAIDSNDFRMMSIFGPEFDQKADRDPGFEQIRQLVRARMNHGN